MWERLLFGRSLITALVVSYTQSYHDASQSHDGGIHWSRGTRPGRFLFSVTGVGLSCIPELGLIMAPVESYHVGQNSKQLHGT